MKIPSSLIRDVEYYNQVQNELRSLEQNRQEIKERIVDEFAKTGMHFIETPSGLKATVYLKVGLGVINIGEAKDTLDKDTFNSLIRSPSELIVKPVKE